MEIDLISYFYIEISVLLYLGLFRDFFNFIFFIRIKLCSKGCLMIFIFEKIK